LLFEKRKAQPKLVNSITAKLLPDYPIKEIGRVLSHLLVFMVVVPAEETIMFAKINLSDGSGTCWGGTPINATSRMYCPAAPVSQLGL
jgi:hypothetical protein